MFQMRCKSLFQRVANISNTLTLYLKRIANVSKVCKCFKRIANVSNALQMFQTRW